MQEAECRPPGRVQRLPVRARRFQQGKGADNIGVDKGRRAMDRAINMAFGGEMDQCPWTMRVQQLADQRPVANIAVHELVPRITVQAAQRIQVAGIGELVKIDHQLVALCQPVEHKVPTDKSGTARNQNGHDVLLE